MTKKLGYSLHKVARLRKDSSNSPLRRVSEWFASVCCDVGCILFVFSGVYWLCSILRGVLASIWKESQGYHLVVVFLRYPTTLNDDCYQIFIVVTEIHNLVFES